MRPLKEFVEDRSLIDRKGLGTGESEVDLSEDSPVESGIAELRSRVLAAFNLQILEIKSSIATSFDSLGAYDLSAVTRIVNAKLDSFVSQLLRDGKLNLGVNDELVHTQIELPDDLARFLEIIEFISELFGRINSLKAEASLKKVGFEAKVVGARDDLEVLNEIPISRRGEEWKRGESRALGTVERFDRKASGTKRRIRVLDSKCQSVLNSVGSFEELEAALEELIVFLKSGWIEGREAKAMLADMHSNGGVDRDLFAADFSTRVNGGARTGVAKRVRSSRSRVVALAAAIGGAAALLATIVLTNSPTKSTKPVKIPSGSELKAGPGLMAGKYADYFGEGSVEKARDYLRDINLKGMKSIIAHTDKRIEVGHLFPAVIDGRSPGKLREIMPRPYYATGRVLAVEEEPNGAGSIHKTVTLWIEFTGVPEWSYQTTLEVTTDGMPPYWGGSTDI